MEKEIITRETLVSVVMPVYNGEQYLNLAIDSILQQTYDNLELIIVISYKSNKKTFEICRNYEKKDKRVVLVTQYESGIFDALNIGIDNARGKYIARMDADDISAHNRIEEQVRFLDNNIHIDIVGSDVIRINERNEELGTWKFGYTDEEIKANLLFDTSFCHPAVMLRSEVLRQSKYIDVKAEDAELWMRLSKNHYFANLELPLLYYRTHSDASSKTSSYKMYISRANSIRKYLVEALGIDNTIDDINFINTGVSCDYIEDLSKYASDQIILLKSIFKNNSKFKLYDEKELKRVIKKRLSWILGFWGGESFWNNTCNRVSVDDILDYIEDCKTKSEYSSKEIEIFQDMDYISKSWNSFLNSNKNIIVYGYGRRGKEIVNILDDLICKKAINFRFSGISDRRDLSNEILPYNYIPIDKLNQQGDVIVVSSQLFFEEMKGELILNGVSPDKIMMDGWIEGIRKGE